MPEKENAYNVCFEEQDTSNSKELRVNFEENSLTRAEQVFQKLKNIFQDSEISVN